MLGDKLDEESRLAYTDGCGRQGHHTYACYQTDRQGGQQNTKRAYLSILVTVAEGESKDIAEALDSDLHMLLNLTHSIATMATSLNLAAEKPSRSQIERDIKLPLRRRHAQNLDTGISWVSGYIGIKGNQEVDQHATFHSH